MDLAGHLIRAWDYSVTPQRHAPPSIKECAADVPVEELRAKRKELQAVQARCYVSRIHLAFIDQVLAHVAMASVHQ